LRSFFIFVSSFQKKNPQLVIAVPLNDIESPIPKLEPSAGAVIVTTGALVTVMSNVAIQPSLLFPAYASANVSASTCTKELNVPFEVSCSILDTSVIVVPSADMSNVVIKPSISKPAYASANVSASTCTKEL